jgi:AcrR family transcriptional regulator
MNGFERRTQQKRDAILTAARTLFIKEGISDVSVSDIATLAGVSPVTIFKYFGDKMTLARETVMTYMNDAMSDYEEMLNSDIPFVEKLRLTLSKKQEGISLFGQSLLNNVALDDPVLMEMIKEISYGRAVPLYMKFIESGKREGAIDPTIPNEAILDYFFMFLTLLNRPDFLQQGSEYMMGLVKLSFYGLIGKPDAELFASF